MHELLKGFVERLHDGANANLEAVILYGSAARGDFNEAHSDLNILCVMHSLSAAELQRIAPVLKWWSGDHHQTPPLFFTLEELRQSSDVFAIELLDMQKTHRVLYGTDVISAIHVSMNLHRIQVEHELRTTLLKLRNHFLRASSDSKELSAVMAKSFSSILTLLRHVLIAFQQDPPSEPRDVIAKIASATGAPTQGFESALSLRTSNAPQTDAVTSYGAYLSGLEKVIVAIDRQIPKHQLQRVTTAKP
ncbi:MAG TPA: nucleotidyltransferase domain-containing protein [Candidatus Acidoferrum sp.]|jgi:hypothetical protein